MVCPQSEISQPCFSSGSWVEIDSRCWVEIISTQHQAVIPFTENPLTIRPLQRLWYRYTLIHDFSSISTCTKHHNPFHQSLTAVSNSSLRARGHVGCWVELMWLVTYIVDTYQSTTKFPLHLKYKYTTKTSKFRAIMYICRKYLCKFRML